MSGTSIIAEIVMSLSVFKQYHLWGFEIKPIPVIYANKKESSDFHGTVSFDPVKISQQK